MFEAEEFPRSSDPGLDFIKDQKDVLALRESTEVAQEAIGCRKHAGLTLDRLEHHGGRAICDRLLDLLEIVQRHFGKSWHLGFEELVPPRLSRRRHCRQRSPVEAVVHGDDLVGAVAISLSPFPGELDRSLDRFRTAVCKERPMQAAVSFN